MAGGRDWFTESFRQEWDGQTAAIGRFNLAIFGKTGVGKSTLINAVFGEDVAQTGIGEPVTHGSHLYVDRIGHLGIVDTQGLELGKDNKEILAELTRAMNQMRRLPLSEQLHVAWYCVRGLDRRFEDAEADFIRRLDEIGLQVVLVLTQVPVRDGEFHPDAVELARVITERRLPLAGGRPFLVNARPDPFSGQPAHGLQDVLDATFRAAPEGAHEALTAAQEVDHARKARESQRYVAAAATAAATAAFIPIPFSDAATLVPIQLGMMAKIAQVHKISFDRAALMAIASTTAATSAGRATFGSLLKLVPGAGSVAGGMMSAGVASSFTYAMGQAWLAVCQRVVRGKLGGLGQALDSSLVREAFLEEFKQRLKIRRDDKQAV